MDETGVSEDRRQELVERELEENDKRSYVEAEDELQGKRAAAVAGIIDMLVEAEGAAIPFGTLLQGVGMDSQPAQMTPAMHALELTGVIRRFTYVETGATKPRSAYALVLEEES